MWSWAKSLREVVNNMDAKAITSLTVSLTLLGFVITMFVFGPRWLNPGDEDMLSRLLGRAAESPLALLGVISVYVLLALTGFPQIALFAATVLVFGPVQGAIYSWIGTMVSATLTFGMGHFFGGQWVKRFGGERTQATIDFLGRHGIIASGLIRIVPSAPFIVVNAAAGAAHLPLWKYLVGSGIGIVPKIAVVAFLRVLVPDKAAFNQGIGGILAFFTSREPKELAIVAAVVVGWIGLLFLARFAYLRLRRRGDASAETERDEKD
ncbi:MAG: VTT domain-containing protein [Parvularculaceae bacterium]